MRDTAPVGGIMRVPNVMEVNPSVPAKTVAEFIAYAKANPRKINFASAGAGSLSHVAAALFAIMAGVELVHVPYRGEALGVTDHRFLGGTGRWRDSGMMGLPDNEDPRCFWQANVDEAAAELKTILDEVEADVIVTYDANGFYGHPDHIQAHRVAKRAHELTGQRAKFYATAMPRSVLAEAVRLPEDSWFTKNPDLSASMPDDQVTTAIDATRYLGAKLAAMRAHETQITVDGEFFALSNDLGQRALGTEYFTLLAGPRGPGEPYERDLFARAPVRTR